MLSDQVEAANPEIGKVVKMGIKATYGQEELAKYMHFVRVFRDRNQEAEGLWKLANGN